MKSTVFSLKLFRTDVQNVYIEIQQKGQDNPTQYEMNLKQKNQEMMLYVYPIKLDPKQLYRYRYIQKNKNESLKEENFRRFQKNRDEENLVDEWNKVWSGIEVEFDKKDFFGECEKFQIFRNLRPYPSKTSDNNFFYLKQLSNDFKFSEKQETLTFTNDQNEKEFQIYKTQEIHLNCVTTIITFGQLGKQLIKQLGPNFQYLLEQVENKFLQKDDQIKQYQQIIEQKTQLLCQSMEQLKQKQGLAEEFELLQKQSLKKFEEHIDQINKLQIEVEKQKEIALSFQFEQLKVKRIDFDMNNVADKSQTSDELLELLQKYQNSLDEIDQLRNQDNQQQESKEKANEFLKKKNEKLANIIQSCENQLSDVEKKLNQYEEELKNANEQKQKNEQTIKALRSQIKKQQEELQHHKDFSNKIQVQLEESEQRQIQLKNDLELQIKANEEIENNFKKIIEEDKKIQKQAEASLLENLESLQNQVFESENALKLTVEELSYLRKEIQKKDEDITEMVQENKKHSQMRKELEEQISIFEASKHEKSLDDENLKNQISKLNEQLKQEKTRFDEYIKKSEQDLQALNEKHKIQYDQMNNEIMKLEHGKNDQKKTIQQLTEILTQLKSFNQEITQLEDTIKVQT